MLNKRALCPTNKKTPSIMICKLFLCFASKAAAATCVQVDTQRNHAGHRALCIYFKYI